MKILVALAGNSVDSQVADQFGRAPWFGIYDSVKKTSEIVPNPYSGESHEAGIKSLEILKTKKIQAAMAGRFGLKVTNLLADQHIRLIIPVVPLSFRQIIERIKAADPENTPPKIQ